MLLGEAHHSAPSTAQLQIRMGQQHFLIELELLLQTAEMDVGEGVLIDLLLGGNGSWDYTEALLEVILEKSNEVAL